MALKKAAASAVHRIAQRKSFTSHPRALALFSLLCLIGSHTLTHDLQAGYIWKNGKLYDEKYIATMTADEHFHKGLSLLKEKKYEDAAIEFMIVEQSFPESSLAADSCYYLGIIAYEESDLDIANRYFSQYLKKGSVPEHYDDVFRYKLAIATRLAKGEKRHLFGYQSLPKLMTGRQIALDTFDEIIKAMPYQEIGAQATLEKGDLLALREEFPKAIECYQSVIRKFPRSQFALTAFQAISNCYRKQLELEPQNTDALALAEINVREAKQMFFSAEEIQALSQEVRTMREGAATALFKTAELYEKMGEQKAAALCYVNILQRFPATDASELSKIKLKELSEYVKELSLQPPIS